VKVVWFRRDLRLADHPALADAAARGPVVAVFVLDPRLRGRSPRRDRWIEASLLALDADLRRHGARLIVRSGEPAAELVRVAREAGATGVWWNRDYSPYARRRDLAVNAACRAAGLEPRAFADAELTEPPAPAVARTRSSRRSIAPGSGATGHRPWPRRSASRPAPRSTR
jgi:deoxyribodipyrimidine photo-lyase